MSPLMIVAIVWGAVTAVLVVLLIYRSTLSMHEDEQLFLDDTQSHMREEQTELLARITKIQPFVRLFGAASGVLILVMAGLFVWQAFNTMQ